MAYQTIDYALRAAVATITLNRPDRLNALTAEMLEELMDALGKAGREDDARSILITGAGRGFCAGADLAAGLPPIVDGAPDLGQSMDQHYNPLIRTLRDVELPIVAAVNGPCAGGGMGIALAADIVVAARSATFLQAFSRIGLIPDMGSTWFLPRYVGKARALGMAMLGEELDAETAADWGLIWRVVDDDRLMAESTAIAERLAAGATRGLSLTRKAMDETWKNSLEAQLDLERDLQRIAGRTEDFREGVTAFLEKRPAVFKGR